MVYDDMIWYVVKVNSCYYLRLRLQFHQQLPRVWIIFIECEYHYKVGQCNKRKELGILMPFFSRKKERKKERKMNNWSIVLMIYKDEESGAFLFDESQYTAAVNDLEAIMTNTVETMDLRTLIERQTSFMLRYMNDCVSEEFSADLKLRDTNKQEYFTLLVLITTMEAREKREEKEKT